MKQIKNYRIAQKHDLPSNWEKAKNFIPLAGEIIVYLPEHGSDTRIKIGNGIFNPNTKKIEGTSINDLPFFGESSSKPMVWGDFINNPEPIGKLAWGDFANNIKPISNLAWGDFTNNIEPIGSLAWGIF